MQRSAREGPIHIGVYSFIGPHCLVAVANGLLKMMALAPAALAVMGDRGREFVLKKHTYPVLAKRFLKALGTDRRS